MVEEKAYEVKHAVGPDHVEITTKGEVRNEGEWRNQISEVIGIVRASGFKNVLMDEREMGIPSDVMSHIGIVKFVLNNDEIDITTLRIALISNRTNMIANLFGEMFANNRGITIKMFAENGNAIKWLNAET